MKRFIAASSQRAIRDRGETCDGACRDGRRPNRTLLAAGAKEYERRELSRRAERGGMAGTSATSSAAVRRELDVKVLSVVRLHSTPRTDRAGSEEQDPAYDPRRV